MDNSSSIVSFIKSLNLPPLKKFGQNFLINKGIVKKILDDAGDLSNRHVIEIGPGLGILTKEIIAKNPQRFTVIEFDTRFRDILSKSQIDQIIFQDVMLTNLEELTEPGTIILSNLPYNISVQLLYKLWPIFQSFDFFIFMFQKEVADRILALPNTKSYGKLSVFMQLYCDIQKVADLQPGSFYPAPAVSSTVLKIAPKQSAPVLSITKFNAFLTAMFENRRKKLQKKLNRLITTVDDFVISQYPKRAENLSPAEYLELFTRTL